MGEVVKIGDWYADKLALVRCRVCRDEWPDMEAALNIDGGPCRNGCNVLTDAVYELDGRERYRRVVR